MEWTWFKDWWRLKKLRSRHQRHKKKEAAAAAAGAAVTAAAVLPGSDCKVEGVGSKDPQTNRRHSLDAVPSDGTIARRRRGRGRDRLRRNRLLQRQRRSQSAGVSSQPGSENALIRSQDDDDDDGEYGPFNVSDYEDYGPNHGSDEDSDDFCFCDVCMNGDTDFGDSNDGMDSDTSTSSSNSKQVVVGICAMAKKTQSKPMKEILTRLGEFEFIKLVTFEENVILREPVQNWPTCDCLVSFHSKGFPLEKAIEYAQLRNPFVLNNLHMQYDIQDRRRVYAILEKEGIEIPRYAVLDRDSPDPKHHELIESEDHVEVNGITFNKPFVEKPVSAEDHNIYIYYPTSAGGGSQRLFRKIGSRSSVYSPESRVRKTGSFIYEDFMPTDVYFSGTDVKVYTVGPDYAHAEARKSPALDGKVERDSEGKEIRYPVILNHSEKLISRKVCLAFKQTVCGFDLLRANGKSYVCDVNGFSFVKNSNKYYDDCAKILGNMILRELTPTLHIPWSVPFQLDDPPIVPTTFGKMMELRCVVAVIRHGDRTPKQKMKVEVRHPKFFEIFEKYDGYKLGHVKLKRPKQLQEILDIARFLLSEIHTKAHAEIEEKESKLEQLKNVLEMYGHFSGINRKVQMKYQPKGRPRGSSSDDTADQPVEPSLVLILKWGGELTPAGRIQAEELGRIFRCMYPGGQGRSDYSGTQGLGLLRLHSTFRHDLKIYASDEGRVQMTAAAFAKGLLALEGELTPILVQMVKSANTNGLLDNDCDSSKYQNLAKGRLHELMQNDREFSKEDRELINPCNSKSITQALDFVKNPVDCCHHVHQLIRELLHIISIKKDDPKTKDAILYHGETWDLMRCRWEKIEKDFSTKSKLFDISKIPDIYDCIKYDLQHNQHTLQYDQAEELYIYAKNLADIVIPQEYGLTPQEKLAIGQGICSPLLRKIKGDLQRNIDEVEDEFMNRLNPHYSHGVASPQRHVRTRLYFTSESHVHSLLTVLRYGGLLNVVTDEQWRRAMDYISMVSELNYMSQIVIMLYEDPTKDPTSEERFHVELHFSPGVNCCVQKNLPPGPGFRPHSHGDNACNVSMQSSDESNPARIEEENDSNSGEEREGKKRASTGQRSSDRSAERTSPAFGFNRLELRSKQFKSKPIPIGAHHTVSGHEAMDLAKRLNEELASQQQQQQQNQQLRPISPDIRAVSPDCEPRSRSFEQRPSSGVCAKEPVVGPNCKEVSQAVTPQFEDITEARTAEFAEITHARVGVTNSSDGGAFQKAGNRTALQIRVTDSLSFFKIDSSTNELPLSDIDFSLHPATPQCGPLSHKRLHVLTMRRMESCDEGDDLEQLRHLPQISPMATNERPLSSCNCSSSAVQAHSHSKSLMDLGQAIAPIGPAETGQDLETGGEASTAAEVSASSFDDDFQLSSSAPAILMSSHFSQRPLVANLSPMAHATTSPTASTLRLCQDMDKAWATALDSASSSAQRKATSSSCGQLSMPATAPAVTENPFRFTVSSVGAATASSACFVNCFEPIEEQVTPTMEVDSQPPQPEPQVVYNLPTLLITGAASNTEMTSKKEASRMTKTPIISTIFAPIDGEISQDIALPIDIGIQTAECTTIVTPTHITTDVTIDTTTVTPTVTPTDTIGKAIPTVTTTDISKGIQNVTPITSRTAIQTSPPTFTTSNSNTTTTTTAAAAAAAEAALFDNTKTMSSNQPFTNQFQSIDPTSNDAPHQHHEHHEHQHQYQHHHKNSKTTITDQQQQQISCTMNNTLNENTTTATNTNTTTTTPSCCTTTIATDSQVSVSVSASVSSANSSTSSRRQRHSIAGQMSYMKMLGFGGFSKKMATSANSLFSTAVISGSSSAPNLRDMIPVSSSGFGDVPPIRPLETLHNALSLRKLDSFLQDMILAQIFKTPTGSPPRGFAKSTLPAVSSMTLNAASGNEAPVAGQPAMPKPATPTFDRRGSEYGSTIDAHPQESQCPILDDSNSVLLQSLAEKMQLWPQDSLPAAEEEEVSLPDLEMKPSLDLTMEIMEQGTTAAPTSFQPMNRDSLESGEGAVGGGIFLSVCEEQGSGSTCLTPVSFGVDLDLSMVANKGSMTLSMDGFEDDEDATLSAATTPSLPADCEPRLETCYCCPSHAEGPPEVASDDPRFGFALPVRVTQASPEHGRPLRRAHDPVSPRIQKQISLFEGTAAQAHAVGQEKCESSGSVGAGGAILHASINLPAAGPQHLRQDARLRKFENLTQSTSNSNFPFESNTLKRVPMVATDDYANVSHTQSCINLKSDSSGVLGGSPQHQKGGSGGAGGVGGAGAVPAEREPPRAHYGRMINACCSASASPSPSPGALIVKERFIEPPKRGVVRGYHGKTQSMDADFLFNEFLLLPAMAPAKLSFDSTDIDRASDDEATSTSQQRHS
ncbi:inositol hexakisphosphate and diphosphoinositol-pentakisphosphate kinase isoform X4 [Drosophila gunungcola]|uniref:inositol hexakisphosphate and diphosphoinositol-pentakisphosphate kinase isoform X4 n=1 Tax=Drosophila gunungcola TaxID=103775 RepID=UPI0022E956FA|nr:inositol hexakisphosphate and diphosphoinositol-pentakisphosphate kinase isoform X4 [Drosophila gunungcola]